MCSRKCIAAGDAQNVSASVYAGCVSNVSPSASNDSRSNRLRRIQGTSADPFGAS